MNKKRIISFVTAVCMIAVCLPIHAEAKQITKRSAAKKLALKEVKGAVVTEIDTDYESGNVIYEVDLHKGKREYNLKYRAKDSKLIEYEWELIYDKDSPVVKVSKAKVKKKAKKKVKGAKIVSTVLDADHDDAEYKVTLKKGTKKYKLVYDASSGALEGYCWQIAGKKTGTKYIGLQKAKSIAAKKVPGATIVKVDFEMDDGVPVYEFEMRKGRMEYDLKIHAKTGKIIEYDADYDD